MQARSAALNAVRMACRAKILAKRLGGEDALAEESDIQTGLLAEDQARPPSATGSPVSATHASNLRAKSLRRDTPLAMVDNERQNWVLSDISALKDLIISQWVNILLVCVPFAIAAEYLHWSPVPIFLLNFMSLVPLALILGDVTEDLSITLGPTVGGLVNATFGNITEIVLSIAALHRGLLTVVANSLIGSILSNLLLVMGMSFIFGGLSHKTQAWNPNSNRSYSSLLFLASIGVVMPTAAAHMIPAQDRAVGHVLGVSRGAAIVLIICYVCYLVFQLHTHRDMFKEGDEGEGRDAEAGPPSLQLSMTLARSTSIARGVVEAEKDELPVLTMTGSLIALCIISFLVAVHSEFLTGALEETSKDTGISTAFLSMVVLPIAGNACEHITAVIVAAKNKMDLSLGIAIGSSLQIALFAIPLVVLVGWAIGQPMSLDYDLFSVTALMLSVMHAAQVTADAESHWLMGIQLVAVYLLIALVFWYRND